MNHKFLKILEQIEIGSLSVVTPEGKKYFFEGKIAGSDGTLQLNDWRTITHFAAKGDIGLAEAYRNGWWDTDDLSALLIVGLENEALISSYLYGGFFSQLVARIMYFFSRNTIKGSKNNIQAHYDLGNDFYELWLDPTMTYSSALYANDDEPLVDAQNRKYDRMIERLDRNSGSLLEIGCGWGGFADRAMQANDFGVKGITLSNQQHDYATERLGDSAVIALEDYRHQKGKYDSIISIEMFEAVGEKYWPTYFSKIESLLAPKGRAVVQTITIGESYFEKYRKSGDMIRSFIFPGGMLPTPTRFEHESNQASLKVTDQFSFGKDYAKTLRVWLKDFESTLPQVRSLGYDEGFIRMWRFYLSACIAGFETGRTDVMQMELQHA